MSYPIIFYFKSPYCSPCVAVEEMLDDINISLFGNRLNIRKIDILQESDLAQKYNILSVPTVLIGKIRLSVVIDKNELTDAILQGFLTSISFEDEPPIPTETELPDINSLISVSGLKSEDENNQENIPNGRE